MLSNYAIHTKIEFISSRHEKTAKYTMVATYTTYTQRHEKCEKQTKTNITFLILFLVLQLNNKKCTRYRSIDCPIETFFLCICAKLILLQEIDLFMSLDGTHFL